MFYLFRARCLRFHIQNCDPKQGLEDKIFSFSTELHVRLNVSGMRLFKPLCPSLSPRSALSRASWGSVIPQVWVSASPQVHWAPGEAMKARGMQKSLVAQEFVGGMADSRTGEELPVTLPEASGSEGKETGVFQGLLKTATNETWR